MRFVLCAFFLAFTTAGQSQSLNQMTWLIGKWQSVQNDMVFTETWETLNDSTLVGTSTITKNGEEQFAEQLKIEKRGNRLKYVAILPSKTAIFPLEELTHNSVKFLDPNNDFPSRITYEITDSGMTITLEGSDPSKPQVEKLNFTKK